jgi:hypothetical protein
MRRQPTHAAPPPRAPRPDPLALPAWDTPPSGTEAAAARTTFVAAWEAFRRGDLASARRLAGPLTVDAPDPEVQRRAADLRERLHLDRPTLVAWGVACLLFLWIWIAFT